MGSARFSGLIGFLLCLPLGLGGFSQSVAAQHFAAPFGEGEWRLTKTRLLCRISHEIPSYGEASFSQRNGQGLYFELASFQDTKPRSLGNIYGMHPAWHDKSASYKLFSVPLFSGRVPLTLEERDARKLLQVLRGGDLLRIIYRSYTDNAVKVDLSVARFQGVYGDFIQCIGQLVPFTFEDVRHFTLGFGSNGVAISDDGREKLNKMLMYLNADPRPLVVRIAGHTDSQGRSGVNNYLSERRAKLVRDYFLQAGFPKDRMKVIWYGSRRPIASNKTEKGRMENRRVEIKLLQ